MDAPSQSDFFHFGDFRLHRDGRGLLQRDSAGAWALVPIGSRALDVLGVLIHRHGELVPKHAIFAAVWPNIVVEESNLSVQLSTLRRVLDQDRAEGSCIQTVPGRGYRFVVPLEPQEETPRSPLHVERPLGQGTPEASRPSDKPSIAVLAFDNMSGVPDQEYFSDGIADDIITQLSHSTMLFVIARNSAFSYKGRAVDVKLVGRELGVRYVLEGSVRRAGERVRISAQLLEAETGRHIWAERFDRTLADVFMVQDEISDAVATAIGPVVADAEMKRAMRRPPHSLGVWELYQQGLWHLAKAEAAANDEARRLFERAIEQDPLFAAAYIKLSWVCGLSGIHYRTIPMPEALRLNLMYARNAVELDPNDADAYAGLSVALGWGGDMENALMTGWRALSINPNCAWGHFHLGSALIFTGRTAEGRAIHEKFARLSPRDPSIAAMNVVSAQSYYFDRNYQQCVALLQRQLSTYPNNPLTNFFLACALGQLGRVDEARTALETAKSNSGADFNPGARRPWYRTEDHEHLIEGLRKAAWKG